jgi:hypothetical protein
LVLETETEAATSDLESESNLGRGMGILCNFFFFCCYFFIQTLLRRD